MKEKGFTLIELMVVIVIMGIMAAMAVPNLRSGIPRMRLDNARRGLISDLRSLRQRTMTEYRWFGIDLPTADGTSYSIFIDKNRDGKYVASDDSMLATIDIEKSVVIQGANCQPQAFVFSGDGRVRKYTSGIGIQSTDAHISLKNSKGDSLAIDMFSSGIILQ